MIPLSLKYMLDLSLVIILFLYLNAFTNKPLPKENTITSSWIDDLKTSLKNGDLVLRLNNDPSSQLIKLFNRKDKKYSHAGILVMENNVPYVYHMISGEENPDGKMKKEKLEDFSNWKNNSAIGIYRYTMNETEVNTAINSLLSLYKTEIIFDTELDLGSEDKLYCAELIKKLIENATGNRIRIGTTLPGSMEARVIANHTKVPFDVMKKREIVSMDNLYMIDQCILIKKFQWN